jgi:CDGSH-type Zn-finger protein/uncharacterized Fe-S cluster protein YjdI
MGGAQVYRGKGITVRFDGDKCIHSRNCVLTLPGVFRANVEGAWIDADGAASEEIAAVARSCPSGAITYERRDGGPDERAPAVNTVRVLENGPLAVVADLSLGDATMTRATLCRCGASRSKPYCDGSHVGAGFVASGERVPGESQALQARSGRLSITPSKDGPLLVAGNVEIICATGRTIQKTTKCALCRCGASQNKPFCDGSHKAAGFRAD